MSNLLYNKYNSHPSNILNRINYFKSRLKDIQPDLVLIDNYVNFTTKIKVQNKYGICYCFPSRLLDGAIPCIRTAINKNEYFINQAIEVHADRYDYSLVNYKNSQTKVKIICEEHGLFLQTPSHHLKPNGCYKCGHKNKLGGHYYNNSENFNKICNMYILKFNGINEQFFKYGVSINLRKRLETLNRECNHIYKIEIIKKIVNTVKYCYDLEQKFKRKIWRYRRTYIPKVEFGGMYECFK